MIVKREEKLKIKDLEFLPFGEKVFLEEYLIYDLGVMFKKLGYLNKERETVEKMICYSALINKPLYYIRFKKILLSGVKVPDDNFILLSPVTDNKPWGYHILNVYTPLGYTIFKTKDFSKQIFVFKSLDTGLLACYWVFKMEKLDRKINWNDLKAKSFLKSIRRTLDFV